MKDRDLTPEEVAALGRISKMLAEHFCSKDGLGIPRFGPFPPMQVAYAVIVALRDGGDA